MPRHKKKPFIDKKNSVRFHLVHRSQQDPLAADEDAPQLLLQKVESRSDKDQVKEEERKFGVFYDDDYNYLQHLKDRTVVEHDWSAADRFIIERGKRAADAAAAAASGGEGTSSSAPTNQQQQPSHVKVGKLTLPSQVFASEQEEEIGLLNRAAPRGLDLSLDPDVVAAMDEDFDFDNPDNELDDDFVLQAMGEGGGDDEDDEEGDWETDDEDYDSGNERMGGRSDDEEGDVVPELVPWDDDLEETRTRFTNYSMSSSIIRRNKELSLLDDKFDKFMDQYGEMDEGALDGEEIEGAEREEGVRMKELIKQAEQERLTRRQKIDREKEITRRLATIQSDDEAEKEELEEVEVGREEKWDCETYLSTYSNLYNHPKLISERSNSKDLIKLSSKTGLPLDTLGRGLTAAALKRLDMENRINEEDDLRSMTSRVSELSVRNKHETADEKKLRKAAVKEYRRERRIERKANTLAFKEEKCRQEKIFINNQKNMQGNKIL